MNKLSFNVEEKLAQFEFVHSNTLFEPDMRIATEKCRCPFCGCKLYLMRNRPFYYCKSTTHYNKFIISKDKMKQKITN